MSHATGWPCPALPAGRSKRRSAMAQRETKNLVVEAKNSVINAIHGVGDVAGAGADTPSPKRVHLFQGTRASASELRRAGTGTGPGATQKGAPGGGGGGKG